MARETTNDSRPWVQLKEFLSMQIEQGILKPGAEVPLTREAKEFGVDQKTAQKAFRALAEEGKLIPRRNKENRTE
jgi:DNA-binding transcriptional regulator YhcF (GntR family)